MLTERMQVLVSPEQRKALERVAARNKISVGALIREAIEAYVAPRRRTKDEALKDLLSLNLPVDDWEVMKAEIEAGALR